jgi:hypothetical protein
MFFQGFDFERAVFGKLAGFCVISYRENHDLWVAANLRFDGVCRVKNRPIGDF